MSVLPIAHTERKSRMAREIVHIPARTQLAGKQAEPERKIRLAAYCRVSSEQDEQLNSFENQVTYYKSYIMSHPEYELAGIYADEGISGTSTKKRDEFNKMIADCEAGAIDMVITKSISRFARNTQDCLNYSRKLKDLGIGIKFEKEQINTLDSTGELLFTILSSLAQDESRSISENCQWGIRSLFKRGVQKINTNRFYGYDSDENGKLIINEEQAKVVKWIFESYMEGVNPDVIVKILNEKGVQTCMGGNKWTCSQIKNILKNEKHMGDSILQKTYTPDYLTHKSVQNDGQLPKYHIKEDHEAIVSSELWQAVQMEMDRRKKYMEKYSLKTMGQHTDENPFSHRVICGRCNHTMSRRTYARLNGKIKVWQCSQYYAKKGEHLCSSRVLKENIIYEAFELAWNQILAERKNKEKEWERMIREGNPLEAYRGKQFLRLTLPNEKTKIGKQLVSMVLECCIYEENGDMTICFLDGSKIQIEL